MCFIASVYYVFFNSSQCLLWVLSQSDWFNNKFNIAIIHCRLLVPRHSLVFSTKRVLLDLNGPLIRLDPFPVKRQFLPMTCSYFLVYNFWAPGNLCVNNVCQAVLFKNTHQTIKRKLQGHHQVSLFLGWTQDQVFASLASIWIDRALAHRAEFHT